MNRKFLAGVVIANAAAAGMQIDHVIYAVFVKGAAGEAAVSAALVCWCGLFALINASRLLRGR